MALPVFRAAGAKTVGTTTATAVTAPAGVATGDLEILIATTIAAGTVTIGSAGGSAWTVLSSQDVSLGERLYIWWRIRQSGDTDPTVSAASDHFCAGRLCYQAGTFDSSSPFENVVAGTEVGSDTSFSFAPGGSTSGSDRLVCCVASTGFDSNTHQVPIMTNANLTALALRMSNHNTQTGGGGGFGMTEGARASAGAVGTFACTYVTSSTKAMISFAIKPVPGPSQTSVARISLAAGSIPVTRTAHSIKVRARVTSGAGTIKAALYEGANNRSGDLESSALTSSLAEYTLAISDANAANITSYADLEIRLWGYVASPGGAIVFEVDQVWLEMPPAAAAVTHYGATSMAITFSKAVSGTRKTFSAIAAPFAFSAVISGQRKTFGTIAMPIAFSAVTVGQRKTFSTISMPITFGAVVAGQRTAVTHYGAVSMPIAFNSVTEGRRKSFGTVVMPIGFSATTVGQRKTFSTVVMPVTFGKAVAGQRKAFGALSMPIAFSAVIAGQRVPFTRYGVVSMPIAFNAVTDGRRKMYGQVAMPITFGKDVRGQRKTFGQLLSPFIFGKSVTGQRKTFGQIALPINVSIAISGFVAGSTFFGVVSLPITFGKDVRGQRKAFGQVAMPITFSKQVQGQRKTFSQIIFPIIFTKEAIGRKNVFGQLSMPMIFGKETAGRRKTFSQIAMPIVFSKAVAGRKQTFGRIVFPINVVIVVDGYVSSHLHYGSLSMPITFNKQVLGRRKTFGQVNAPFIFGETTRGYRKTFSGLVLPIDFGSVVQSGPVGTYGKIVFPINMGFETNGIARRAATILNDAVAVYLGEIPVEAVYAEGQKVWPMI